MKFFLSVCAIVVIMLLISCNGKKIDSPLVGNWKLENTEFVNDGKYVDVNKSVDSVNKEGLAKTVKETLDTTGGRIVTPADSAGIEGAIEGANMVSGLTKGFMGLYKLEFKSNGTVKKKILFSSQDADYTISPDGKTVSYTLEGEENNMEIISVTDKALVLKNKFTYTVLTFKKIED
ncbi:MAG: hypothetical protein Q8M29_09795 [Bacteroidota bacterium]|nr:hypothetical protein [Bacteroidota bacterium]